MTQRSDSCGRVHDESASEVPFLQLKRVRLNRECDSEVQLTLAVRRVHTKDQRSKTDVYNQCCVQVVFRVATAVTCSN